MLHSDVMPDSRPQVQELERGVKSLEQVLLLDQFSLLSRLYTTNPHAVRLAGLSANAYRMRIGACNPMLLSDVMPTSGLQACEKSRKANEESFKAAASAGQQPTGMMKKIADNKIVGSLFSKFTKDRAESKELTEHKTHNVHATFRSVPVVYLCPLGSASASR